jgi:PAS domain-containing protein
MDRAYLEVILQAIDVGIVLIEGSSRNVVFANPAFLNMIDKQSHEVIGLSRTMLSAVLRGLARDELELHNRFDAIPETGGYSGLAQIELSKPRRRVIDWHARSVHLEKGGFGQVCVFVDVTDQVDRSLAEKRLCS